MAFLPPLADFKPDRIRVGLEGELLRRLTRELGGLSPTPRDYVEVRKEWFWASELLPDEQRERAQRLAALTRERLGVSREIDIFQKAGLAHHLNAATYRSSDGPILVQLSGPFLDRLDDDGVIAVLGHEIGHHLAHGPSSVGGLDPFFLYQWLASGRRAGHRELAAAYCRAAELTADRVGILACRDVDAVVRMEAVIAGEALGRVDSMAGLQRSREYAEDLVSKRRRSVGDSHPEKAIRIYAIWLFSESDAYRELTGAGPGTRPIEEVDAILSRLVGPSESAEDYGLPPDGEPCVVDRTRDALTRSSQRVRETVTTMVRGLAGDATPIVVASRDGDDDYSHALAELDRDPLEEKFAQLDRALERAADDDLERRFTELERRAKSDT